jgi:hypothetical protein
MQIPSQYANGICEQFRLGKSTRQRWRQHGRFTEQDGEAAAGRAAQCLYGHALTVRAIPASTQMPLRLHLERSPDHVGYGSGQMVADRLLLPGLLGRASD